MKVIDAFAGLGGFSLAADALGWNTVAFVEWDKDCQFWLGEHWPNVPIYGDITTVRWEDAPRCDIFTAGFPCQPHSVAGKRAASDDSRDLWSECVRAISTLRPRYAVLENVPGLLTSESGRFFNRVLSDLAKIGYVGRYDVLSAADCGAPHRRERVWIVCWPMDDAHSGRCKQRDGVGNATNERREGLRAGGQQELRSYAGSGLPVRRGSQLRHPWADAIPYRGADGTVRLIPAGAIEEEVARPESALRVVADGIPHGLAGRHAAEEAKSWATPNERDWHAPGGDRTGHAQSVAVDVSTFGGTGGSLWPVTDSEPGRVARLKAVGNSVVPAWVLAGPFQFILDRKRLRDNAPAV